MASAETVFVKIKDITRSSSKFPLCARVAWILREPLTSHGGNKYLKYLLRDTSGMIQAVAVGENCMDKFQKLLKLNQVYIFDNYVPVLCREKDNVGHKYSIYLNIDTDVKLSNTEIPEKFYSVSWLKDHYAILKDSTYIDVCGKVFSTNFESSDRRVLKFGDEEDKNSIPFTIWRDHAQNRVAVGDHLRMRQVLYRLIEDNEPTKEGQK